MKSLIRVDEDRKVVLYTRDLKQGKTYYARFRLSKTNLSNNQEYIRESMQTPKLEIATTRALQRFAEITVLQNNDMVIRGKKVEQGIEDFINEYKERLEEGWSNYSTHMLRIYRRHVQNYWIPYIGEMKLSLVKEKEFRDYEKWRMSNYIKSPPSPRTLQLEITCMKTVMSWCRENGYYSGEPINFVFRLRNRNRRSAFTREQYRRITQYLRTNEWLEVGKHKQRGVFDSKIVRHRNMLREYFLFASNIGMRVGEMKEIRWRDVSIEQTETKKKYVRVRVSLQTKVGKSGKSRERIGRVTSAHALERIREMRSDNLKPDDYVFCSPEGKQIGDFRQGFNTMLKLASEWIPRTGGEPIDCEFDTDGVKMTPYCCRHTYITFQLRFRKHPDVYAIAQNCGTSVSMIEKYYSDARSEDFVERLI